MADEPTKLSITLPPRDGTGPPETFTDLSSLVLVGPNGSGKSKLGFWIDTKQPGYTRAHRIAAQRALKISKQIEPKSYELAEIGVLYAGQSLGHKNRLPDSQTAILVDNFDALLTLLLAEEAKGYQEHGEKTKQTKAYEPMPESRIDQLLNIWRELLPHRELRLQDHRLRSYCKTVHVTFNHEPIFHDRSMLQRVGETPRNSCRFARSTVAIGDDG